MPAIPLPTPADLLQIRDTSIQPHTTLNDASSPAQTSPPYTLPLILGLSAAFLLFSLALFIALKRRLARERDQHTVNCLSVDVCVDVYTVSSEGEVVKEIKLSRNSELLLNSVTLGKLADLEGTEEASAEKVLLPLTCSEDGVLRRSFLPELDFSDTFDFPLGDMLGQMDVEFFTHSTIRFPRLSLKHPLTRLADGFSEGASPSASSCGKICCESPIVRTVLCLSGERTPVFDCNHTSKDHACDHLNSTTQACLTIGASKRLDSTSDATATLAPERLSVTPKKRPYSAVSSILPITSNFSPLILTTFTPLQVDDSPVLSPPGSVDLRTFWSSHSPLLSVQLNMDNIDSDDTLVSHDTFAEIKPKPSDERARTAVLSTSTRPSPSLDLDAQATPQICVQLAATPSPDSLCGLTMATPSSNLLTQPAPALLPSVWYEPSSAIPPIRNIARVLLFENMEDAPLPTVSQLSLPRPAVNDEGFQHRSSVSSLLSAFAFPLIDSTFRTSLDLLDVDIHPQVDRSSYNSNGLLTPGSFTSTRYSSASRRSRSRTLSASRSCSSRSPSIRQTLSRPSAPTPGSLLSRLSLRSVVTSPSLSPLTTNSDTPTGTHVSPFRRPSAPTPGSVLSQASQESQIRFSFLEQRLLNVSAADLSPSVCSRSFSWSSSILDTSPYLRPHWSSPSSVTSVF
ncbi:hypothetical protein BC629DRAFT_243128 [Irpex lacteus]|nr:hypothetical protein BC629DRAFT_243128 [Irpex lacteus]